MPFEIFSKLPAEKQQSIISAAVAEFSTQSYAAASISEIVRQVKIGRGSFYRYFADKKDLYLYIIHLGMDKKMELVRGLKSAPNGLKTFDYLRWMLQASVQFEIEHPQYARIAYRAFVEDIPFPDEMDAMQKQGGAAYFNDLLAQGILHDDVAPWVDTDMGAYLLQTITTSFGRYFLKRWQSLQDGSPSAKLDIFTDPSAQALFDNLLELIEAGMGRDPLIRQQYYSK